VVNRRTEGTRNRRAETDKLHLQRKHIWTKGSGWRGYWTGECTSVYECPLFIVVVAMVVRVVLVALFVVVAEEVVAVVVVVVVVAVLVVLVVVVVVVTW
jgi:hypothetical protein